MCLLEAVEPSSPLVYQSSRGSGQTHRANFGLLRECPELWPVWSHGSADASQVKALLAPYPSEEMVAWPVSARVGNVKNNDPSLIEPIAGAG
jgi:putative SOS response-associated peptidase YedK